MKKDFGTPEGWQTAPLRVLMLHPFLEGVGITPSLGGKSVVAYQVTRQLLERGHTVAILPWKEKLGQDCVFGIGDYGRAAVFATQPFPGTPALLAKSARHLGLFAGMGLRRTEENALSLMGLERAIRIFRPDLIHVHYTRSSFATLYPALKGAPPAVLTHFHGAGNDLESYSGIAFPSEMQRRDTAGKGLGRGIPSTVIPPPVNPQYLQAKSLARKDRLRETVFVGRLEDDRKGLDLLLQALQSKPDLKSYRLNVVGDGPMRGGYESFARDNGLNVRFLGNVPTAEIVELMRRCLLLVTPSRWESFGVVYAESICCGTPVIGYAPMVEELSMLIGCPIGIPYAAADGPIRLAEAMTMALEEGRFGDAEYESIRTAACGAFRLETYGDRYLAFYRRILQSSGRGPGIVTANQVDTGGKERVPS